MKPRHRGVHTTPEVNMSAARLELYYALVKALIEGDEGTVQSLTTNDFTADLSQFGLTKLTREQLLVEVARQKAGFSDFGKRVEHPRAVIGAGKDANRLTIHVTHKATFDGTLRSRHPRGGSVSGDGRGVEMRQCDVITFTDDHTKISHMRVIPDSEYNIAQLFQ